MKILITGGSGALGKSLKKVFKKQAAHYVREHAAHYVREHAAHYVRGGVFSPTHAEMDVTNADSVNKTIVDYKPDILIHAAAFVDIRGCDENKEKAWLTNVEGTQNVVNALKKLDNNCYLMYISTACVFAGEKEKYYTEEDIPSPKNYYSFTKLCGEIIVRQYENTCIIRTNFAPKQKWKYPKAFTDRFGTYLFSDGVAKGISEVAEKREKGIIHIVGDRRMSMYELALLAGSKNVGKMTLEDYEGPPVTVDMSLSTKRWKKYKIE
jgi:dTDP-4-dehydrorhamnose reductase